MSGNFEWYNDISKRFMEGSYLIDGVTIEQRVREIAHTAERYLKMEGFADKFYDYMSRGWYSLSTPVWTNYGNMRGTPISCFGSFVDDNMESILYTTAEVGMMSKFGGGTSGYFGALRPRGAEIRNNGKTSGSVHFMQLFDAVANVISQGSSRRGSFAAYLDIDHPDIEEFLDLRTEGNIIQDLSYGVCISDEWMKSMLDGDTSKRSLWAKIIQRRYEYGFPYIFFAGNVNKGTVDVYKDKGMKIHASNLCSEIMLPSSSDESFVCCLSSMNLLHYDDWKNTDAVQVLTMFLDTVITDFIKFTKGVLFMERSRNFAKNHRALGIGVLGWHSYLQKNNLPFGGVPTTLKNAEIFKYLAQETKAASEKLAKRFGEPKVLKGYGRRNTTLMAIAPTVSSATILGQVSPSIEPLSSNYFIADKAKLKYTYKNPYLMEVLNKYGENTEETWRSILDNFGSVQHLPFLTDDEKEVFLTFSEISQKDIVTQAAVRQNFIDQGQSLNLMIHPDTSAKDVSQLMIEAWKNGVKSLYYQHSINAAQKFSKNLLNCSSCEA